MDFAYAVHTGVGQRCVAAKVDRRLVPLRTVLRNGQTVEIVTAKARTEPGWASFVATAKARSAIRQYLKNLKRGEAAELGGRMLNRARGVRAVGEKLPRAGSTNRAFARAPRRPGAPRENRPRREVRAPDRAPAPARR